MTDKQIIIDGIDVAGCEYFNKFRNICHNKNLCCDCEKNPNCYYKQLKRSEAQLEGMFVSHTDLEMKYKAKEHECEELKEEIDDLKEIIQRHDNDNNALLSEFEDDLVDYYRRHKECLIEIKEYCEEQNLKADWTACEILQKISEVKMTNELEKKFFDTFGIKAKTYLLCTSGWDCTDAQPCEQCSFSKLIENEYPKITDRILLELICLNNIYLWEIHPNTVNELKNILLEKYIEHVNLMADENEKQEYIQQVQALFKEDNK